jgi:cytochrome P450
VDMMSEITVEVIINTMFGINVLSREEIHRTHTAFSQMTDYLGARTLMAMLSLPKTIPLPNQKEYERNLAWIASKVKALIAERRTNPGDDLMSMLIQTVDAETNEQMTEQQLFDEAVSIFIAGFETTASTLQWVPLILEQNPEVYQKMQAEVDSVLGDRLPTFEDLPKLEYTRRVFLEALRLYLPITMLMRCPTEDDVIDGHPIPKGSVVVLHMYGTHHDPAIWPDPERFDPERHTAENSAGRSAFAFVPFSGGPRKCVGDEFALFEGVLVMAMMAQRYKINVVPHGTVKSTITLVVRATPPIEVVLQPREATR